MATTLETRIAAHQIATRLQRTGSDPSTLRAIERATAALKALYAANASDQEVERAVHALDLIVSRTR
jgi:hypothetical protein